MSDSVVMVSDCLLGTPCRYDGKTKLSQELIEYLQGYRIIPFCPESFGNLPVPRLPSEIQAGDGAAVLAGTAKVRNCLGGDYTPQFLAGAEATLQLFRENQPDFVVGKARSPSCGVGCIYDGSFSGKVCPGDGVAMALLRQNGAVLHTEDSIIQK